MGAFSPEGQPAAHDVFCTVRGGRLPKWLLKVVIRYPTAPQLASASPKKLAEIPFVTAERARCLTQAASESVASQQDEDTAFVMEYMAE